MIRETDDFIKDIIDAIDDIEIFLKGFDFNTFIKNKKTIYAVIRAIEIIGEAVKKIPSTLKDENPFIPWRQIAGMRDKLIHGYFGIDMMILWKTITEDIPKIRESVLQMMKNKNIDKSGFSMVEIAIVMVIIGILTAGGMSMMRTLTERKSRNESIDYLNRAKEAIITFSAVNGRLPRPDNPANGITGVEEPCAAANNCSGFVPYRVLNLPSRDPYGRYVKYEIFVQLGAAGITLATTCNILQTWNVSSGTRPLIVDQDDPAAAQIAVPAILISGGPMDADGLGGQNQNQFDRINAGIWQGDNITGLPNYIRNRPIATFDDLVGYIGGMELLSNVCKQVVLTVNNPTGGTGIVWIRNITIAGSPNDIGSINDNNSSVFNLLSGSRIEVRNAAGGGGALLATLNLPCFAAPCAGNTYNVP
ncbi:MAG: DUF86 domain-containing protein [Desulfobacterales bacterium]|nr:DUF86 domain-containing protein [Desulfobacterales bacterium]